MGTLNVCKKVGCGQQEARVAVTGIAA